MAVLVEMAKPFACGPKCDGIAGDVPPRRVECSVAQVTGQQQEMMGNGFRLTAPLRNPLRSKRMPEVHKTHRALFLGRSHILGEAAKHPLRSTDAERLTGRAYKQVFSPRKKG